MHSNVRGMRWKCEANVELYWAIELTLLMTYAAGSGFAILGRARLVAEVGHGQGLSSDENVHRFRCCDQLSSQHLTDKWFQAYACYSNGVSYLRVPRTLTR